MWFVRDVRPSLSVGVSASVELLHQQNPAEIVALADKAINYLHYTRL